MIYPKKIYGKITGCKKLDTAAKTAKDDMHNMLESVAMCIREGNIEDFSYYKPDFSAFDYMARRYVRCSCIIGCAKYVFHKHSDYQLDYNRCTIDIIKTNDDSDKMSLELNNKQSSLLLDAFINYKNKLHDVNTCDRMKQLMMPCLNKEELDGDADCAIVKAYKGVCDE